MPEPQPPEGGTLIIAALLLLAIGFAGYWIANYASSGGRPWGALSWFAVGAVVIVAIGIVAYIRGRRP